MTPPWATASEALGVCNSQQVGWCSLTSPSSGLHAVLWSGDSNSCVDLHPPFWKSSIAFATSGSNQVGEVEKYVTGTSYAALWSGSAASFVELGPEWWSSTTVIWSRAVAAGGTNQAGFYQLSNTSGRRAALWSGSPGSFVSLHPVGATASSAWATTDTLQAGTATVDGQLCLAIWRGTAQSFVNLGPISSGFGTGLTNLSMRAVGIEGNVLFLAGSVDSEAVTAKVELLPPDLHLDSVRSQQGGAQVVGLRWANSGVPCVLEGSDNLLAGWEVSPGTQTTNANWISTTVTNAALVHYFRLRAD